MVGEPGSGEFLEHYKILMEGGEPTADEMADFRSFAFLNGALPRKVSGMLSKAKSRAAKKNVGYSLNAEWLRSQWKAQDGRCALSGVLLDFENVVGRNPNFPSIDRIDSGGGYTPENCRLVTVIVNLARLDWSDADFLAMCRSVAKESKDG